MSFKIENYEFNIKLLSGLYIGAGDTEMRIGGVDNKVIRNPADDKPYIPGSSLKGKVRSLLEYLAGIQTIKEDGSVFSAEDINNDGLDEEKKKDIETIVKLFGAGGSEKSKCGVTRLSFADAYLSEDDNGKDNLFEVKAETAINRNTGTADTGSLRFSERVVAGTVFKGSISMKIFDGDDYEKFKETLLKGLKLLTLDALGGYGSRGYGRIEITFGDTDTQQTFIGITFDDEDKQKASKDTEL